MTKSRRNNSTGELTTPPLLPDASQLQRSANLENNLVGAPAKAAGKQHASENIINCIVSSETGKSSSVKCTQILWLTYFFDGTGNNLDADVNLLKHSNIARLYRIHKPTNEEQGIYRFYIPGVSTYFPEIGDNGASALGSGFGAMGEARLVHALRKFDQALAKPLSRASSQANAIKEINIAVFGFSRGAALARAFVNMLMESRCKLHGQLWRLNNGQWPVKFRFIGLFDTVASVGNPMSRNNTDYYNPLLSDVVGMISERIEDYPHTSPPALAFSSKGAAGADPAPGKYAGHDSWGKRMAIHETVMEVRHFIAAHEVRNSFPVDSISRLIGGQILKPSHFYETVYPGAHSDVGGGYAPGEGARGLLPTENFSLIPLRHMYEYALAQNVPFLPITARLNIDDFKVDSKMQDCYNHYLAVVGTSGGVGTDFRAHMRMYYAWRFSVINRKRQGEVKEAKLIRSASQYFRDQRNQANIDVERISKQAANAESKVNALSGTNKWQNNYGMKAVGTDHKPELEEASSKHRALSKEKLKIMAHRDAIPNMDNFETFLEMYEEQLMRDVNSIRGAMRDARDNKSSIAIFTNLRPHYRVLIDAFEDEFEAKGGLKDDRILAFFDNYIHDSLSGFARDATLPSDPRVVYLGGDEKLRFADISRNATKEEGFA